MLCLTKLGLPNILNITAPKGHALIWRFYFSLCSKVSVKFEQKTARTGIEKCEMHVVNLVIEYTLVIKENTKTHKQVVDGKMQKVKEIVTPGGEFTDDPRIIKAGQLI